MAVFSRRGFHLSELRRLVRNKKIKFEWKPHHTKEFIDLCDALLSHACHGFPIYSQGNKDISPLILSTDYSQYGLAAILSQIQYKKEVLISCSARKCTPVEQSYSSIKGELRAVLFGI